MSEPGAADRGEHRLGVVVASRSDANLVRAVARKLDVTPEQFLLSSAVVAAEKVVAADIANRHWRRKVTSRWLTFVSERQLQDRFARLLRRARHGEEIVIVLHGRPVARLAGLDGQLAIPDRRTRLPRRTSHRGEGQGDERAAQPGFDGLEADSELARAHQAVADGALDRAHDETMAALIARSLSEEATSRLLRQPVDAVRQAAHVGRLYAFTIGGRAHFPRWQFHGPAVLPWLNVIVAAAGGPAAVAMLQTFMTTPSDHLLADNRAQTPRDWLRSGRSVAPVIALLEGRKHT
ncbi:prevent-host-death family protein [Curtobacterium sp. PhB142]|uniref:type II toxin-antitoxin system prevent-host-death family antitoxin n=1 Tax=unclassified Curtobacterium TaxID=257496 RepID=UPI0010470A16|nr:MULTISPECIES: type II toxin-antitoxin system prevent-host-death family antitoxin [unclassified Curtobacterium]TCL88756.1 prevent-host-death family protein [Curtobacterium sp. PhB142]TCM03881.1 prevent-host-death family protein [Curtobacterium sp. PhB134]